MNSLEVGLRILGVAADVITIMVVIIDIILRMKSKKYNSENTYDCRISRYTAFKDIPDRFKSFKGGIDQLNCSVIWDKEEDSTGINYTFISPNNSMIIRNVKIYVINLYTIGDGPIRKRDNYRLLEEYKTLKNTLCINCSPGDCLPGFLVEWRDFHGKHRYYSNLEEISSRFDKDIVIYL